MIGLTVLLGFFHSPFDKLRANGKILSLMAVLVSNILWGINAYPTKFIKFST